ncbi:MAG: hypothetical protein JWP97_278 [Labilithrix sp.]|nr:hypothetical protein [Labilithrix sp.]
MKRIALTLLAASALALVACDNGTSDSLSNGNGGGIGDPNGTAGGEDTTFDHINDPNGAAPGADTNPPTEAAQVKIVGSPEVTSRLHACGKLTVSSIGSILTTRGLTGGGMRPNGVQSGQGIYMANGTAAALGAANYNGRVGEAPFSSASAMAKMFDIFAMASYDAVVDGWAAPACPDTKVLGADGKFTKDGLSCLMGKPASAEHLAVANDAITKNPADGAKIAIAAVLAAAHTCQ